MKMAEPAEYGVGYLARFRSVDEPGRRTPTGVRSSAAWVTAWTALGRTSTGSRIAGRRKRSRNKRDPLSLSTANATGRFLRPAAGPNPEKVSPAVPAQVVVGDEPGNDHVDRDGFIAPGAPRGAYALCSRLISRTLVGIHARTLASGVEGVGCITYIVGALGNRDTGRSVQVAVN